jgi:hypothetical protein
MSNTNIYDKWDNTIDTEGLSKDIKEAAENGGTGDYKEVPHGEYEVAIHQMELKASKKGDPMVSIWFKIVSDGEYKGSMIFFNQVITQAFQIHIVNEMLRMIVSEMTDADEYIQRIEDTKEKFSYKEYGNLIMDIFEDASENFEYALEYKKGKKDFSTYTISEVFPLD